MEDHKVLCGMCGGVFEEDELPVEKDIEDMQVFITACDDRNIDTHGKIFHIRSGRIENN